MCICCRCGNRNDEHAKFCPVCGERQLDREKEAMGDMAEWLCTKCENKNDASSDFCIFCGASRNAINEAGRIAPKGAPTDSKWKGGRDREKRTRVKWFVGAGISMLPIAVILILIGSNRKSDTVPLAETQSTTQSISTGRTLAAGDIFSMAVQTDGTVVTTGAVWSDIEGWSEIVSVSANTNSALGLKADGTVVAVGDSSTGQCDVGDWTEVRMVSAGYAHSVGLKADGTVVAVGEKVNGACDVEKWKNIVAVEAGWYHTVGVKSDGTVVMAGESLYLNPSMIETWENIVSAEVEADCVIGLKSDGTIVWAGAKDSAAAKAAEAQWKDIASIAMSADHVVGITKDGAVVTAGENTYGQCGVHWTDMVEIAVGNGHTIGITKFGKVNASGLNQTNQCEVDGWTNVARSSMDVDLRRSDEETELNIRYHPVSAGAYHTVAVRSDGTVVACGDNKYGQCDLDTWTDIAAVYAGKRYNDWCEIKWTGCCGGKQRK